LIWVLKEELKVGQIIAEGSPEKISKNKNSFTGKYLKNIL
jgi:excinuclease UvrABC ATPase subunit